MEGKTHGINYIEIDDNLRNVLVNDYAELMSDMVAASKKLYDKIDGDAKDYDNKAYKARSNCWNSDSYNMLNEKSNVLHSLADKFKSFLDTFSFYSSSEVQNSSNPLIEEKLLSDDWAKRKPICMMISDEKYDVKNNIDILLNICEYLYTRRDVQFERIALSRKIKGKSRIYFSKNKLELVRGKRIGESDLYVEGNLSTNDIRKIITDTLRECGVPESIMSIYFRKEENDTGAEAVKEATKKPQSMTKIGAFARKFFIEYFSVNHEAEVYLFKDKKWCHDTFGISYPILKEIDTRPLKVQLRPDGGTSRYWTKPILNIGNKNYVLCSQWFEEYREKLNKWIKSQGKIKTDDSEKNKWIKNQSETKTDNLKKNGIIKFGNRADSFKLSVDIVTKILLYIKKEYNNKSSFNPGDIARFYEKELLREYRNASYPVTELFKNLLENGIIRHAEGKKRKWYVVKDENRLNIAISRPKTLIDEKWNPTHIVAPVVEVRILDKKDRKKCVRCGNKLVHNSLSYIVYTDSTKAEVLRENSTNQTKCCPNCHKVYMTVGTYNSVIGDKLKDRTNLQFEYKLGMSKIG